jgi:hypothetical protein
VTITENVTLWVCVVGEELDKLAVPVITTVKVVVEATLPLKVTTSLTFCPAVKLTGLVAKATESPVPPVIVEESVTGPAKPAALTPAATPDGRLPILIEPVVELPELKLAGFPLTMVTLKSWGLTRTVTAWVFV